jgi:Holliday junction resolvasome RuvABC endonuclease subunit
MPYSKNILALDLGANCGYAINSVNIFNSGTKKLEPTAKQKRERQKNKTEHGGIKFANFKKFLEELKNSNEIFSPIDIVAFELVERHGKFNNIYASHAYGGYYAILTAFCEEHNLPCYGFPVGTIKKHISGSGRSKKDAVIQSVKFLGHDPKDNNEADAIAIHDLAIHKLT